MRILVVDNFDSFTFNLVHYLEQFCNEVVVKRNNEVSMNEVGNFDKIVFSPGPGISSEVPVMFEIIKVYGTIKPILGVCLGHHAIAEAFGGRLLNLEEPSHGKALKTMVTDKNDYFFREIPVSFESGRYHSWVVDKENLPGDLVITSIDEAGRVMSLRHKISDIRGIQFHPESIMTEYGKKMIENWVLYRG